MIRIFSNIGNMTVRVNSVAIAVISLISLCGVCESFGQISSGVLEIPAKGVFELPKDTLVIDQIIMRDSSTLVLTKAAVNFIKVRRMSVGSGCTIQGDGLIGASGKAGKKIDAPAGLCKHGLDGEPGQQGQNGEQGKDFILDVVQLDVKASIDISLVGGNGGDGGVGGKGSDGSRSTIHCSCDGGNGGTGGKGGNGGRGGTLTIRVQSPSSSELITKINLNNRGGYRGLGGDGGKYGNRGPGASEQSSKHGLPGKEGVEGQNGLEGKPLFYSITNTAPVATAITSVNSK